MSMKLNPVTGRSHKNSPFFRILRGVRHLFRRHLLLTNLTISATLSTLGDGIEQSYELYQAQEPEYDLKRTGIMAASGISTGFITHHWYILLDRYLPGRTLTLALKKVILDQIICSPISMAAFFGTTSILEGKSFEEFCSEVRCKSWRLYVAEWFVWPPAQLINYYFLPLRFRVLYDNTIPLAMIFTPPILRITLPSNVIKVPR